MKHNYQKRGYTKDVTFVGKLDTKEVFGQAYQAHLNSMTSFEQNPQFEVVEYSQPPHQATKSFQPVVPLTKIV